MLNLCLNIYESQSTYAYTAWIDVISKNLKNYSNSFMNSCEGTVEEQN